MCSASTVVLYGETALRAVRLQSMVWSQSTKLKVSAQTDYNLENAFFLKDEDVR